MADGSHFERKPIKSPSLQRLTNFAEIWQGGAH